MEEKYQNLPLRSGVGIVVLNKENKIFVAKRIDNPKNFWQMPQGGVDKDEDFYTAALRELKEETSIVSVKPIKEILNDKPISVSYKKEIQLDDSALKEYIGKYYDIEDNSSITTLTLGKNALIFNSTYNPWDMPFYPNSKNTFFSKAPRMNIGFEFINENGIMKLIFLQNGKQIGTSIKK